MSTPGRARRDREGRGAGAAGDAGDDRRQLGLNPGHQSLFQRGLLQGSKAKHQQLTQALLCRQGLLAGVDDGCGVDGPVEDDGQTVLDMGSRDSPEETHTLIGGSQIDDRLVVKQELTAVARAP